MEKRSLFFLLLFGLIVMSFAVTPASGADYFDINYNVTTGEGEIVVSVEMVNYELSAINVPSIGVSTSPLSKDFNILVVPPTNCTIENIYHTTATATASGTNYTFIKSIPINPGKYLVIVLNPGVSWSSEEIYYDKWGCTPAQFWDVVKNEIDDKTQAEILEIAWSTLEVYASDDRIFVQDPLVESKQIPEITPTPTSMPIPTPTPTITPAPTLTPTPTPEPTSIITPSPSPLASSTPTPEPSGFEMIYIISGLLAIYYLLSRRRATPIKCG